MLKKTQTIKMKSKDIKWQKLKRKTTDTYSYKENYCGKNGKKKVAKAQHKTDDMILNIFYTIQIEIILPH